MNFSKIKLLDKKYMFYDKLHTKLFIFLCDDVALLLLSVSTDFLSLSLLSVPSSLFKIIRRYLFQIRCDRIGLINKTYLENIKR